MGTPNTYSYQRYLVAKRTVDARALNHRVWTRFIDELVEQSSSLQVLEVGAGIGATTRRALEAISEKSIDRLEYTLLDVNQDNLNVAHERLRDWLDGSENWNLVETEGGMLAAEEEGGVVVTLRFTQADLFEHAETATKQSYDALISQAVFDLLPLRAALTSLRPLLKNQGLWYLPIHFDGLTAFEPPIEPSLDDRIERLYHRSMCPDNETASGVVGAHTGRRLLTQLPDVGAKLLEVGSSDWIVHPTNREYPSDEAYFLQHILHFLETELSGHPTLDASVFNSWIEKRREQIEEGTLIYIAHQLDILAQQAG